ncbi:MAG: hypothetical protein A2289_19980 [Deltaproteobacteria bacterium RIFOXYA12_FULL_58_15]|nr:MAG: hypothetical protein A2289_19980 [Deltaproteobacteria bacterium RIFOXYA12_FULL_58_15]OGR08935.1 MAG: hypothetical protein A2341_12730 [Deltaproteobacteria bacterium RIFOXYB12_FULL_58_9]
MSPEKQKSWGPVLVFELGPSVGHRDPPVLDGRRGVFGIEVAQLLQVAEPGTISPVPLAPTVVLGIMNFHGRIVTVVNPAPILGVNNVPAMPGPDTRVLLLRQGQLAKGNVGLYVSRVHSILPSGELSSADVSTGPCVKWVLQHSQRLINIIHVEHLLDRLIREFGAGQQVRQGVH